MTGKLITNKKSAASSLPARPKLRDDKKSVKNFLEDYNLQATSDSKKTFIQNNNANIKIVSDYNENDGFGNFETLC